MDDHSHQCVFFVIYLFSDLAEHEVQARPHQAFGGLAVTGNVRDFCSGETEVHFARKRGADTVQPRVEVSGALAALRRSHS